MPVIAGIESKVDYLNDLKVDVVWLSPFYPSPMKDFGYDISDYRNVDQVYGTLDDIRSLVSKLHDLGMSNFTEEPVHTALGLICH